MIKKLPTAIQFLLCENIARISRSWLAVPSFVDVTIIRAVPMLALENCEETRVDVAEIDLKEVRMLRTIQKNIRTQGNKS